MKKIYSVDKIKQADSYTIVNEPIASIDLMERAATALFRRIFPKITPETNIKIFAGMGNNGGDGLVLARLLHQQGMNVDVYVLMIFEKGSPDFEINLKRLEAINCKIHILKPEDNLPEIPKGSLIIDALIGSGLNKPIVGFAGKIIDHLNASKNVIISIDIPSGLFADQVSAGKHNSIINADYTYTFEWPKLAFLLPENEFHVGNWEILPIGLHPDFESQTPTDYFLIEQFDIKAMLKTRKRFAHKGNFGHALLIAGATDKTGAAILSANACMRAGAGKLHVHLPKNAVIPLQCSVPEAMLSIDPHPDYFSFVPDISKFSFVGIGPGIGTNELTTKAFKLLIQQSTGPLVIDADGLNILSENKTWLAFLPKNSILTPHPGEFERLAGKWSSSIEKLEMQRQLAIRFQVIIVLKGAYSSIALPNGNCYFNPTGNPGMATAGSGDVLTGMILGLLSSGYSPQEAALAGVFMHGLAGDIAAQHSGEESLIASDLIKEIGVAFKKVKQN